MHFFLFFSFYVNSTITIIQKEKKAEIVLQHVDMQDTRTCLVLFYVA